MTGSDDAFIKRKTELFERAVAKWSGGRARFFTYSLSHKILVIQVEKPGDATGLHIVCVDVERIAGPTDWTMQRIELDMQSAGRDLKVTLREPAAGLEIHCGAFELKQNVPVQ